MGVWLPLVAGWGPLAQTIPPWLDPGPERAIEASIAPGERQVVGLEIALDLPGGTGRVVRVDAEQRGVDLLLEVADPAGKILARADSPSGAHGGEILAFRPPAAGAYRLFLQAFGQAGGRAGSYRIERTELPERSAADRALAEAALARSRAGGLYAEGGRESLARAAAEAERAVDQAGRAGSAKERRAALALSASFYELLEQPAAAGERWLKALALAEREGDSAATAEAANRLGLLDWQAGRGDAARGRFDQALRLARTAAEPTAEARALNNLGLVEQGTGALYAALDRYERAAALFLAAGDVAEEARAESNAAGIAARLGEPRRALSGYERSLAQLRAAGDSVGAARAGLNAGGVLRTLGELDGAIGRYSEALAGFRAAGDRRGEGSALNSLGAAYLGLGEPRRAAELFHRALDLRRATGDARGEAATLQALGLAEAELGEAQSAEARLHEALALRVGLGDRLGRAATLEELARLRLERAATGDREGWCPGLNCAGDWQRRRRAHEGAEQIQTRTPPREANTAALDLLNAALGLRGEPGHEGEDPAGRGRVLLARGRALRALGRLAEGTADFERARADLALGGDRGGEARALVALARAAAEEGREADATSWLDRALARLEELRARVGLPDLRAGFLSARREAYELAVEIEIDRHERAPKGGFDRRAFAASERGRARTLLDRRAATGASRLDPGLDERRRALGERIAAKELRRLALRAEGQDPALSVRLAAEIEEALVESQLVEAEIARRAPLPAVERTATVEEVQAILGEGELLIEIALGETRSALFAVERGRFAMFPLPGRLTLETAAAEVLAGWGALGPDPAAGGRAAAELSRLLLAPLGSRFAAGPAGERGGRALLIVPDGALHSLPWPALPVFPSADGPDEPLAALARVALLPSASSWAAARRAAVSTGAPRRIAVIADPVFDARDPRLGKGVEAATAAQDGATRGGEPGFDAVHSPFDRLASAGREAEEIAAAAGGREVFLALGLAARRELLLDGGLAGFDVLHFATHGIDHPERPELSALALSQVDAAGRPIAGLLRASDLAGVPLGARLVVLSGCRTARGRDVAGEGPRGLARAFLDAGAGSVVASLWPVPDRATAALMAAFYRGLFAERRSPAEALAAAQLEVRSRREFRHPFFWAAFVLIGDDGRAAEPG